MKIVIINGPNLNLLGKRENDIYGDRSFEDFLPDLASVFPGIGISYFQSNIEGEIVDHIQAVGYECDGIILNAGAYTHTSVAISDAIAAVSAPVVEVHISNIYKREEFRHKSIISKECVGMITGMGLKGYELALRYLAAQ